MSGSYRVPNKRPDERADAPFRFVHYSVKRRDRVRRDLEFLTTRQLADIRATLRRVERTPRSFNAAIYVLSGKYGVRVQTIVQVWNTRRLRLADPFRRIYS